MLVEDLMNVFLREPSVSGIVGAVGIHYGSMLSGLLSVLIILREHHAKTRIHSTEDNGVGEHLHKVRRARRQAQENSRGEEDEEENGDDDVKIHVY